MSKIKEKLLMVIRMVLAIFVVLWFMLLYYFSGQNGVESSLVSQEVVEKVLITKDKISKKIIKLKENIFKAENKDIQTVEEYDIIKGTEKGNVISKERILRWDKLMRKIAHFSLFTVGGFLIYLFLVSLENKLEYSERRLLLSIFIGILVAIFDEYHQKFSIGRTPELKDVFVDSCGMVTGCLLAVVTVFLLVRLVDFILKCKKVKNNKVEIKIN